MTRGFSASTFAILIGLTAAACEGTPATEEHQTAPRQLAVRRVEERPVPIVVEAGGVIEAGTSAVVSSRIVATVETVHVRPGDTVRTGQRLVTLGGQDLEAERAGASSSMDSMEQTRGVIEAERDSARAAHALARATYDRISSLHARGSATSHELDEVTAGLASGEARIRAADARLMELDASLERARASLDAATTRVSFSVLTAPFDGIVTEKLTESGNLAVPGVPLLRLDSGQAFKLLIRVDESRVGFFHVGSQVDVMVPRHAGSIRAPDVLRVAGLVSEVSRAVDDSPHAFLVKVDLPEHPDLKPGLFARARAAVDERIALVVPSEAVRHVGQLPTLFVVSESGVARMRVVSAGVELVDGLEVLAGLAPGEVIVVEPPADLHDGDQILAAEMPSGVVGGA
jgi:multidrug efflux pump subunit AcrA (membrane-fusion protein)